MNLSGKGLFLWQAKQIENGNPELIATSAKTAGLSHVILKVLDGPWDYNISVDLLAIVTALKNQGIQVWGYQWIYLDDPMAEANAARKKVIDLGLDGFVIDAEADAKGKNASAKTYATGLQNFPVSIGLSSYRYPNYHLELPWKELLACCDFVMPQVYWEQAHNPAYQLQESYSQYRKITNLPFAASGAAYIRGEWAATPEDINQFFYKAKEIGITAVNFWEWWRSEQAGLFPTISAYPFGGTIEPPIPPPPVEKKTFIEVTVTSNPRNTADPNPISNNASDMGTFVPNKRFDYLRTVTATSGINYYVGEIYIADSVSKLVEENVEPPPPPPSNLTGFIVMHDKDMGAIWRSNVPEVYHFDQIGATKLTPIWQKLIYDMNKSRGMTPKSYTTNLGTRTAWANGSGFLDPNSPRANYITGEDLSYQDPRLDKCRICGGANLHGTLSGDVLTVETLDGSQNPPSLDWILERPWLYFRAWIVQSDGSVFDFPYAKEVWMPLVATGKITVQINHIEQGKPYPLVKEL